jgi:subtilisin family serine protease
MWQSKIAAFTLILILSLGIMITIVPPALANDMDVTEGVHKLAPEIRSQMNSAKNESKIPIIVMLEQQPSHLSLDLRDAKGDERGLIIHSMKSRAEDNQKDVLDSLEAQRSRGKVEDIKAFWIVNAIAVKATPEVLEQLVQRPEVILVEPDYKVKASGEILPWGVDRIDAELVWNGIEGGTDVVAGRNAGNGINVAILDTGIDWHPDLVENVKGGHRFLGGIDDGNYLDDYGHGTHCAGIVAAVDNNNGVIGTAPKVNLYGVKVFNSSGKGYVSDIIKGIEWSVNNSMHIISMSFGIEINSPPLQTACDDAYNAGLLLVAGAGNDNEYGIDYPAAYDSVIAVGAIDQSDARCDYPGWWGSDWGPELELTAPGDQIYSTYPGGRYTTMSGTSMACPHVTGAAALVWRAFPEYNNIQIRQRLQETAEDLGALGRDYWYGYGLVDAENATLGSISGKITYTCNTTGVAGATVNLTQGGSVMDSTLTDSNGEYTFTNVPSGAYAVNVSKVHFWDSSTDVTVTTGAPMEANMMLWLKGDVYNDGVLDIYDIIMLRQAAAENIPWDYRYNLYVDDTVDIYDIIVLRQAVAGNIVLE